MVLAASAAVVMAVATFLVWTKFQVLTVSGGKAVPGSETRNLWSEYWWLAAALLGSAVLAAIAAVLTTAGRLPQCVPVVVGVVAVGLAVYGVARNPGAPVSGVLGNSSAHFQAVEGDYSRGVGRYVALAAGLGVLVARLGGGAGRKRTNTAREAVPRLRRACPLRCPCLSVLRSSVRRVAACSNAANPATDRGSLRVLGLLVLHLDPHPAGTPEAIRIVRAEVIAQQERLHNGPFVSRPARHDRRRFV